MDYPCKVEVVCIPAGVEVNVPIAVFVVIGIELAPVGGEGVNRCLGDIFTGFYNTVRHRGCLPILDTGDGDLVVLVVCCGSGDNKQSRDRERNKKKRENLLHSGYSL